MADQEITPEKRELHRKLADIFVPLSREKSKFLYPDGEKSPAAKFVHYTSADAALKILRTKRLWMRNTLCMGDYREIQYGHDMTLYAFNNENGKLREEFIAAVDSCSPGIARKAIDQFDENWAFIQRGTYVVCLSEHDQSENQHGRLSMWRAFAPASARVAIVIALPYFTSVSEKIRVIFSPVGYLDQNRVSDELRRVIKNIQDNTEFLKTQVSEVDLSAWIFTMLLAGVTSLKHEGFHEEKEWRGIYCPLVLGGPTEIMKPELQVIGGIPQKVYELPLCKTVSPVLESIDLTKIIDRVILGPSQYSYPMYEAFVDALAEIGVPDPAKRVAISGIPIRT
jgi:Protein of unknown function (DUF2971)